MRPALADVIARARGLETHLLAHDMVRQAAGCRSLPALAALLSRAGYPTESVGSLTVADLDRIIAGVAAARLNLLVRWLGARQDAFRALFDGREVAALRAVLRGIAGGTAPSARLRGLDPTPLLPAPLLARVAAADSVDALHRLLLHAGHPAASLMAATGHLPNKDDLLHLELGLRQWWAGRVRTGARRAGPEARHLAEVTIDRENVVALLLASAWGVEVTVDDLFLAGGRELPEALFRSAASEQDPERRRGVIARGLAGSPMSRILADPGVALGAIPGRLLAAAIATARRESAESPLGAAPLVEVVYRIEAEARNLRRALHALALEAPFSRAMAGMVVAA